jgi:hypothetical protein
MILEYEIMKYDGDLGRPNVFVPLSQDVCQEKIGSLLEVFPTQAKRQTVQRRGVLVAATAARHRVQRAFAAGRRVLCAQEPRLISDSPKVVPPITGFRGLLPPLRACRRQAPLASWSSGKY